MPITEFQSEVLKLLATNRSSESYVAGATVINQKSDSARFSEDIDLFHDPETSVILTAKKDLDLLKSNNFKLNILLETSSFVRVVAYRNSDSVRLEWATDSAFRFFPIIADKDLGFRLHEIDAAINKCLALAGRTAVRDVVDVLTVHDTLLHLGACVWSACGKDPGFTPDLMLEMISRNARVTPDLLAELKLKTTLDPRALKVKWNEALGQAYTLVDKFRAEELGCLYVLKNGEVPKVPKRGDRPHFGSVRGAWPKVVE